jgi:Anti-sigma-K factor rskA
MGDEERIAYLAGESAARLDPTERAELDELSRLLAADAVWAEPDPQLRERIVLAVLAEAGRDAAGAESAQVGSPAAGAEDTRTGATRISPPKPAAETELSRRRRLRQWRYALLGAAAVVLLGVGLIVFTGRGGSHPTRFAASLTGTQLAAGATGSATLTQTVGGWRIQLHATGLPRRDGNEYYEAWLKSTGGVLVPIGTFNEPRDVTLWSGVAPTGYPSITVTQQRADAGPASSKRVVLSGTTHQIS